MELGGAEDRIDDDVNRVSNTEPARGRPGVPLGKQADPRLGLLGLLGPQIPSCQEAGVVECWCGRRTVSTLGSRPSTTLNSRPLAPPATPQPHDPQMMPDCCLTLEPVTATECTPSATISTLGTSRVPAGFHLLCEGPQPGSCLGYHDLQVQQSPQILTSSKAEPACLVQRYFYVQAWAKAWIFSRAG